MTGRTIKQRIYRGYKIEQKTTVEERKQKNENI